MIFTPADAGVFYWAVCIVSEWMIERKNPPAFAEGFSLCFGLIPRMNLEINLQINRSTGLAATTTSNQATESEDCE